MRGSRGNRKGKRQIISLRRAKSRRGEVTAVRAPTSFPSHAHPARSLLLRQWLRQQERVCA